MIQNPSSAFSFSANADNVSHHTPTMAPTPRLAITTKRSISTTHPAVVPTATPQYKPTPLFTTETQEGSRSTATSKLPNYHWHLVLNHASPSVLTRLARNPHLNIPSLTSISTTRDDITCGPCLATKLRRAPHKRKDHNYTRGQAVSSDILGPLAIPGMPIDTET